MELVYSSKANLKDVIDNINTVSFDKKFDVTNNNLILGDNLSVLKTLLTKYNLESKVDLIYIDPPFATNNIFRISNSRANSISSSFDDEIAYSDKLTGSDFLEFLRQRLYLARMLLSDQGSIYVHIDYKIGHYVKIILDEIFGIENFKNDITRIKCNPKNFDRNSYGNIKDLILFYSKNKTCIWNNPITPYTEKDLENLYKKVDKNGRRYTTVPLHAPGETKNGITSKKFKGLYPPKGRHWRCSPEELELLEKQGLIEWSKNGVPRKIIYADDKCGKKMQDIWEYKDPQYPQYPTEKNIDLLKNIIKTSSNENSLILDFFCGSGTTLVAANDLNRNWIGIDSSLKAINSAKKRLLKNTTLLSRPFQLLHSTIENNDYNSNKYITKSTLYNGINI